MKDIDSNKMGLFALILVTASNMMGSGVFLLPTNMGKIGPVSVWGWAATIIGCACLALVFVKTNFLNPKVGGIVAFANDAFGDFVGFQTGLCYWFMSWIGNVGVLVAGVAYLSYFFPILKDPTYSAILCIVFLWGFIALASLGAKVAGSTQSFTAICMLIVVLGVGIFGWFWFRPEVYGEVYNATGDSDGSAIMSAASIALWGFLGIEGAVVACGQVKNPERNVPIATVVGLLIAATCYVSSCVVIMGLVPHNLLANSPAPFADAAKYMLGDWAGNIVSALSVIACLGTMCGWLILQSEGPRAAANAGIFPKFFGETNKNDVPMKSLVFTGILMTIIFFMTMSPNASEQFKILILMSVYACLVPYIYAVIALPITMIAKGKSKSKSFYGYLFLTAVALIYCLFAMLGSGTDTLFWGCLLLQITIPLYSYVAKRKKERGEVILLNQ
ncbi:amino acid permease [Salmonella enterica]|nr:amino acid permease [Salmonella enterica]EEE0505855.1 amino acid permease [Salmonella enterica subsp. enterica serovar Braenderup]EBH7209770.1 amino acid permease [Salmonella enterica]EBJ4346194.1 amino acid permease [Salmonella enterica]EBR7087989.1 amino acid permease [Salmonella enterica]